MTPELAIVDEPQQDDVEYVDSTIELAYPLWLLKQSTARFCIIEGAMRASKTWGCLIILRLRLEEYPGIGMCMSRWIDGDLWNKLVPDYRKVCDWLGLPVGVWNAKEERFDFDNGSYLHVMAMRSAQLATAFSKPRGLTVAQVYVSQLEEVPRDVAREWMQRLSQPGYPQQFFADANPVHDGHWIASDWPEDNSRANYFYVSASIYDNEHNLDPGTIAAAEEMYPPDHPMRPSKLLGKRGASSEGDPVYGGYFHPSLHVDPLVEAWKHAPILCGWDFGAKHPAVSVAQVLPWGAFHSLGAIMGDNVMLEWFAPQVMAILKRWFPEHIDAEGHLSVLHCGDPAGGHRNSQGVTMNAVKTLAGLTLDETGRDTGRGIHLSTIPDSNDLRVRYACVQAIGGYMLRSARPFEGDEPASFKQGVHARPAFRLKPRGILLSMKAGKPVEKSVSLLEQAFGGGYVWDDSFHGIGNLANIRRPKKDGFFEHGMNASEYIAHHHARARPTDKRTEQAVVTAKARAHVEEQLALRRAQRDTHPVDGKPQRSTIVAPTRGVPAGRKSFY
ncbi:MAG: hypothetical protein ABL982_03525 [Vicinamibacterales bacterium]